MIVGVPKETAPGERRVALVPDLAAKLKAAGLDVRLEPGAGAAAGYRDAAYLEKGASLDPDAMGRADVLLKVQPPTVEEVARIQEGATLIGFLQPYGNAEGIRALAARRVTAFAWS
jgi:NAD(P) transhydrogenase subunit alpha